MKKLALKPEESIMNHTYTGNTSISSNNHSASAPSLPVSVPVPKVAAASRWSFLRSPLFLTVVAVPNFIALTYWGLIASPVYQSDAIVIVTNPNKDSDSLTSLLAGNAGASTSGAWILKNRLLSWDEFKSIDQKYHIAETYKHGDFVARAGGLSSFWRTDDIALWHYYQSMVGITIDEQTGITQVNVKGWNSKDAYEISKTLIQDGITHLNHLNEDEDNDFISSATQESERLQKQLAEDEHAISQWRSQHGYLSPVSDYTSLADQAVQLTTKHIELNSQYQSIVRNAPGNPSASSLKTQMSVIENASADARTASQAIFPVAIEYETLDLKRETDSKLMVAAETALQEARIKSAQNHYYLKTVSHPSEPHAPSGPQRLKWILLVLVISLILRALLA